MQDDSELNEWLAQGQRWADGDPERDYAEKFRQILANRDWTALRDWFLPPLEFGTAGLRGVVGPGPARMNVAVIRRVTRALAEVVARRRTPTATGPVVVGFDGRIDSERFAREAVGTLCGRDTEVAYFEYPVPTPLVAFAARHLVAPAAVVITASHNPPEYNGYKVYGAEAIQIVPPFDKEVTDELARTKDARDIPVVGDFGRSHPLSTRLGSEVGEAYVEAVLSSRVFRASAEPICIAYSALHGVGAPWVERVLRGSGYEHLHFEASQCQIDGSFPTVRFPNPEEASSLERGLRLMRDVDADVLIVNDPDADRMGCAIRNGDGTPRILTGNEIGIILTDFILSQSRSPGSAAVTTTVVSSPMTELVAQAYGAHLERTLTGFKWLWSAMRWLEQERGKQFAICWEEALGYSTHPSVRDKDGIAAALCVADWVSHCRREGTIPIEYLGDLYRRHGAWASAPRSLVRPISSGTAEIQRMMSYLATNPPTDLGGHRITQVTDFSLGMESRAPWCGASSMFVLSLGSEARIVVRPSGTEPKLKCYADVREAVGVGENPFDAHARARSLAEVLNESLVRLLEMVASDKP